MNEAGCPSWNSHPASFTPLFPHSTLDWSCLLIHNSHSVSFTPLFPLCTPDWSCWPTWFPHLVNFTPLFPYCIPDWSWLPILQFTFSKFHTAFSSVYPWLRLRCPSSILHCLPSPAHEFHETCPFVTFIVVVNSHQRWKQTRNRVCFHLWCELTVA